MPQLLTKNQETLYYGLQDRANILIELMEAKPLRDIDKHPTEFCLTAGSGTEIRLAIADMRAILKEIEELN